VRGAVAAIESRERGSMDHVNPKRQRGSWEGRLRGRRGASRAKRLRLCLCGSARTTVLRAMPLLIVANLLD
jgi:hypothetical protein